MIYLIEGNDRYLVNVETNKIIDQYKIDKSEIEYYDNKAQLNQVIQSALSFSFFSDKKGVIFNNPSFLTNNENTTFLEQYLENENESTVLIFQVDHLDNRKKIVATLKKHTKFIAIDELTLKNKRAFILNQLKNNKLNLNKASLDLFVSKMPLNAGIIYSEIEKLKLIPQIDETIIQELSSEYFNDSTFEFVDVILSDSLSKSLTYFNRLKQNNSVMQIIGALASKLRLIYQVSVLEKTHAESEIVQLLKSKPYPIKLAFQYVYLKDSLYYLTLLNELNTLSYKIRHGLIEPNLGFDLFLIKKGSL